MLKTYHVHLVEEICGDIIVEAKNEDEAERKAVLSSEVDWHGDRETHVCLVEEVPSGPDDDQPEE